MRSVVSAAASGALFAVGLAVSGMTQPQKVVAFLDFAGDWDPSLLVVMIGAIGVYLPLQRLIYRRKAPLLDGRFHMPREADLTGRLFVGAGVFGVGWGIAGYCPGPALTSLFSGSASAILFVATMLLGIALARVYEGRRASAKPVPRPAQAY